MMTSRRQNLFIGSAVALLFGVLCWISFDFMHSVQQSLWDNSVKNIMESTARGANVLQRGYIKDLEMLRMLANELEQGKSSDSGRIRSKLKRFLSDTGNLSALIFEDGTGYVDTGLAVTLTPQEMETFKGLHESSGLLFPYRNRGTGGGHSPSIRWWISPTGARRTCSRAIMLRLCTPPMPCPSITIRGFPMWWPRTAILPWQLSPSRQQQDLFQPVRSHQPEREQPGCGGVVPQFLEKRQNGHSHVQQPA